MSDFRAELSDLEQQLRERRISVRRLCAEARIAPSTWTRWKAEDGTSPTFSTWARLQKAAAHLIRETAA